LGDLVNLEVDVLGKYVERLLAARLADTREAAEARDERLRGLLTNGA
jgi:riboflavin synthase alpha subunit